MPHDTPKKALVFEVKNDKGAKFDTTENTV
jgi:hypothetical protein